MGFLDHTVSDLRFALRSFRRSPGFTAVALLTLVTGIAALTSIFSYFNAIYFGRLPYRDADRVVAISEQRAARRFVAPGFSNVSLDALPLVRTATRSFERLSAYSDGHAVIVFGRDPQSIRTLAVDTAFIPLFDLQPQIGRLISREEILADARVTMISDELWRTRYGANPDVVGKTIVMRGSAFTIAGVMPIGFRFPWLTDAITPLRPRPDSGSTGRDTYVSILGKLRAGVTRDQARRELAVIAARLASIDATWYRGAELLVRNEMLDRRTRNFLPAPGMFLGAGLFLLLIACANVTSLFYARAAERAGEMAIRASLGASRLRLIRQALTECLLLSAVAAGIGTWLSMLLVRLWLHFVPTQGFASWFHVSVDWRVLAFSIGTTALVTIAVGLAPAREGTRLDLVRTLKGSSGGGISGKNAVRGSKRVLVVQLALSVTLFIAGALLVRSFQHLAVVDVGYPADRIAVVQPFYEQTRYGNPLAPSRFAEDIATRASQLPGVTRTAVRGYFGGFRDARGELAKTSAGVTERYDPRLIPDGDTIKAVRTTPSPTAYVVSDDYFALLGLRLHAGRYLGPADVNGATRAAVIGSRTARLLWGTDQVIGRSVQFGARGEPMIVAGVVDDVRELRGGRDGYNADPGVLVYVSPRQSVSNHPQILAVGSGGPVAARATIVDLVRSADLALIIGRETTMANEFDEAFLITKVLGGVIGAFAIAALALSVIGIYGVVAFGVAQRTHEIGIRIALGGTSSNVLRLITGEAARFVAVGLGLGLLLSTGVSRLLKFLLFGVSSLDAVAYLLVCAVFGGVALLACYIPARRVTRVDPVQALRAD